MTSKIAIMYADLIETEVLWDIANHAQRAALAETADMTEEERKRFADLEAAIMNIIELQGW